VADFNKAQKNNHQKGLHFMRAFLLQLLSQQHTKCAPG